MREEDNRKVPPLTTKRLEEPLTLNEMRVLAVVANSEYIIRGQRIAATNASSIAKEINMSPCRVYQILKILINKGCVKLSPVRGNQRSKMFTTDTERIEIYFRGRRPITLIRVADNGQTVDIGGDGPST